MAWTITNWANADWSDVDILNEFVDAINERDSARGGAGNLASTISAGDDAQAVGNSPVFENMRAWQVAIESMYNTYFIVSHDAGTPRGAGYWDNKAAILKYASLTELFSAAGLSPQTGWRRYTTHPDETGSVAYGQIVAGDIIGPWIFEDLQKVLNVLVHTDSVDSASLINGDTYSTGTGDDFDWETAKTEAEGNWARSGDVDEFYAHSRAEWIGSPSFIYQVRMDRSSGEVQLTGVWNDVTRDVDWYFRGAKYVTWDAQGDDVIEDKYSLWLTDAPATNSTTVVSSTEIGDASVMPDWCAQPNGGATGLGYAQSGANDHARVFRWNVTNGFVYQ